ncbi:MAG: hypothetical protein M1541_18965, partial [Acidobacteria bacterium]|nr:hypothetical protein [Acidobacteriota bacterium]
TNREERMIVMMLLMSMFAAQPSATGMDSGAGSSREKRAELVGKLRTDLARASARANLDAKQRVKLEKAQERLAEAEAVLRSGGMLNPFKMLKMKSALGDVEEMSRGSAFLPEDRQLIQDDIKQLRETRKSQGSD